MYLQHHGRSEYWDKPRKASCKMEKITKFGASQPIDTQVGSKKCVKTLIGYFERPRSTRDNYIKVYCAERGLLLKIGLNQLIKGFNAMPP